MPVPGSGESTAEGEVDVLADIWRLHSDHDDHCRKNHAEFVCVIKREKQMSVDKNGHGHLFFYCGNERMPFLCC